MYEINKRRLAAQAYDALIKQRAANEAAAKLKAERDNEATFRDLCRLPYREALAAFTKMYLKAVFVEVTTVAGLSRRLNLARRTTYDILARYDLTVDRSVGGMVIKERTFCTAWVKGFDDVDPGPLLPGCDYEKAYLAGKAARVAFDRAPAMNDRQERNVEDHAI